MGSAFLNKVSSYNIVDQYTLRINLKEFDSTFLLRLAQSALGQIASPTAMKKGDNTRHDGQGPLRGNGVLRLRQLEAGYLRQYKKWNGYRQKGKPYLDEIKIQ